MRVLHIINGEFYAGAERVQDLLARQLPLQGFDVGFAALRPDRFPGERSYKQAPLHEFPMSFRLDLRPVRKVVELVRADGYQLIHTHGPRSAMIGAAVSVITGLPMVHHVHSPTRRDTEDAIRNLLNTLLEKICLNQAAALIAVSTELENDLKALNSPRRLVVLVRNGVPGIAQLKDRSTPEKNWVLGCVALFRPRKGVEVLLEAVARLHQENMPVRLRLVGTFETPAYERDIRALATELDIDGLIDWVGYTRDVDSELAQMDVFVLPSLYGEGMPMVILEAFAQGVPVIASDVEGLSEAIIDGQTGLLCPPRDPRALAEALNCLIRGDYSWQKLRSAAHEHQQQYFSDTSMAEGVANVYRLMLSGRFD